MPVWQEFGRLLLSQGWLTNTVTGIGLALVFLPAVDLFDSIRARAVGFGVGMTILVWAGVWVYCQAVEAARVGVGPVALPPQKVQTIDPEFPLGESKSKGVGQNKGEQMSHSNEVATASVQAPKVDRSVRIGDGNQLNNSPIITGDNVHFTVNAERTISAEQGARITAAAKELAGGEVQFTAYFSSEDAVAFGAQIGEALHRGGNGWVVRGNAVQRAMATEFDSVKGLAILVKDTMNPPSHSGNFQKVLEKGGLVAPAFVDPTLPSDRVVFWIGRR